MTTGEKIKYVKELMDKIISDSKSYPKIERKNYIKEQMKPIFICLGNDSLDFSIFLTAIMMIKKEKSQYAMMLAFCEDLLDFVAKYRNDF